MKHFRASPVLIEFILPKTPTFTYDFYLLVLSLDGKQGRYHVMIAAHKPKRKVFSLYFCQPKSTKRPCANDAPPRSEKTAKILRTVALEGRDGLLLRPASRIFCCFFIHPDAARRSRVAHAPGPGMGDGWWVMGWSLAPATNQRINFMGDGWWVDRCVMPKNKPVGFDHQHFLSFPLMERTKDQARPKLSARSKKTTQIQARSVKRNASVWLFGLDWRSWCFNIGFLQHCILQTAPFEEGLPCRICCRFFIHPAAGPRGARGSRTHPGDGVKNRNVTQEWRNLAFSSWRGFWQKQGLRSWEV